MLKTATMRASLIPAIEYSEVSSLSSARNADIVGAIVRSKSAMSRRCASLLADLSPDSHLAEKVAATAEVPSAQAPNRDVQVAAASGTARGPATSQAVEAPSVRQGHVEPGTAEATMG